jgi:hypothetical protein
MYRVKPWHQDITPTNQQQCPNVNGCNVPAAIQRLSLPKNHLASIRASTVGITFSVMLFIIAGMPAMHYFTHSNAQRPGQVLLLMWKNPLLGDNGNDCASAREELASLGFGLMTRARLCVHFVLNSDIKQDLLCPVFSDSKSESIRPQELQWPTYSG